MSCVHICNITFAVADNEKHAQNPGYHIRVKILLRQGIHWPTATMGRKSCKATSDIEKGFHSLSCTLIYFTEHCKGKKICFLSDVNDLL